MSTRKVLLQRVAALWLCAAVVNGTAAAQGQTRSMALDSFDGLEIKVPAEKVRNPSKSRPI
jgi:hypothetical protein